MKADSKKRNQIKSEFKKGFYIRIPKQVYDNKKLNDTEKYLFGAFLSLFNIPSNRKNGIPVNVKMLAEAIKVSERLIYLYINSLAENGVIAIEYHNGKRRIFITINDADAFVIIPTDIVSDGTLSPTYKISLGLAFVVRDGYTYNSIDEIADLMGLSRSSVYRHINLFIKYGYIKKDVSASGYRFLANNSYSKDTRDRKAENPHLVKAKQLDRLMKKKANAPNKIYIDPKVAAQNRKADEAIEAIWNKIPGPKGAYRK